VGGAKIAGEVSDMLELAALLAITVAVVVAIRGPGTSLREFRADAQSRPRSLRWPH
jgi:hypothetical protein